MNRYPVVLFTTTLLVATFAGLGVNADDPGRPVPQPTTIGEAIIGFHEGHMPDLKVGDRYMGYPVVQVVEQGDFVVVRTNDLAPLQLRIDGAEDVRYIEDNALLHTLFIPNDARYGEQWGPAPMGFETAWDTTLGDDAVIVSVLDTGIRKTHNDFDDALIMQGYDYVNNDNNPNDDCGHGTHVSGTVGAWTNNGIGVAGMAQVRIMHMKVLSPLINPLITCSGSTSDIADAIYDSADQGAHIISMSLGSTSGSTTLKNAVDSAWNDGVLVVAAAGNENGGPVNYPAAYDSVIAVSALTQSLTIASYSSVGPQVEIAAPGSSVLSTYYSNDNSYSSLSGTSMAAPHVAGALALALSAVPGTSAVTMRNALAASAQDLGSPGRDNSYGYGLARVDQLIDELGGGAPNNPPTASFTKSTSGLSVSVDASASTDLDGDTLTYSWDWGDGGTSSGVTSSHTYTAGGTYTITLTVDDGRGGTDTDAQTVTVTGTPPPPNNPPTASFTKTTTNLRVDVNGAGSSDPDGDPLTYSWSFGDGGTANGVTASHTYAAAGTYTVTLTVDDGRGGSDSDSQQVTVTAPADPDPSTPNLQNGVAVSLTVNANNPDHHYKIQVPAGSSQLQVIIDGPNCGLLSCPVDADLYTRFGQRATDSAYDCRPYEGDSDETCTHANPADGWWYVRVKRYSGSGTVTLKATFT